MHEDRLGHKNHYVHLGKFTLVHHHSLWDLCFLKSQTNDVSRGPRLRATFSSGTRPDSSSTIVVLLQIHLVEAKKSG